MQSTTTDQGSPPPSSKDQGRSVLFRIVASVIVALPILVGGWLVAKYSLNMRIMDDWMLGDDLVRYKNGELGFWELFGVQMEHRIFIPRVINLGLGLAFQGDVRPQNALTMILLVMQFLFVLWLWRKCTGLSPLAKMAGGFLTALLLVNPVQCQTMHFPMCFITAIPLACLAGIFRISLTNWNPWLRISLSLPLVWTAMLSFAPGMLCWVLPLPIFLWVMPMPSGKMRRNFVIAWLAVMAISFTAYFHNFKNAVFAAYSYGQGSENVLSHDTLYFLEHPVDALGFFIRWLGSFLSHGLHTEPWATAATFGTLQLLIYVGLVIHTLRKWKDAEFRKLMILWLSYGLYSIGTGAMVTMGRLWMEPGEGTSMNLRYHVHQVPLIVSLLGGCWAALNHHSKNVAEKSRESRIALGWLTVGALAAMQLVSWSYGTNMMELWNIRHLRNQSVQRFWGLAKDNEFHTKISGDFVYGRNVAMALDKLGYLNKHLFTSANLDQYKVGANVRNNRFSGFDRLWKDDKGMWKARGFAILSGHERAADLIIFAQKKPGETGWTMFGFTMPNEVPMVLNEQWHKDMEGISLHAAPWPRRMLGEWSENVAILSEPSPDAIISAWMLDAKRNYVQRVALGDEFASSENMDVSLLDLDKGTLSINGALNTSAIRPERQAAHQ